MDPIKTVSNALIEGNANIFPEGFDFSPEAWKKVQTRLVKQKQVNVDRAKSRQEAKKLNAVPVIADRRPCECGCGQLPSGKKSRFIPGHDGRLKGLLLTAAKLGDQDAMKRMRDLGWGRFLP